MTNQINLYCRVLPRWLPQQEAACDLQEAGVAQLRLLNFQLLILRVLEVLAFDAAPLTLNHNEQTK